MESAAICRPAIQPSVRASSAAMSASLRFRPILVEKVGGLGGREAQVGGAQLGQLAPGAQAGQRQRRIFAGGDDQVHLWRLVFDEEGQGLIDRSGIERMVVIEHEDERIRDGGDVVEQGCQQRVAGRWLRRLQRSQRPCADTRRNGLQGSDEVGQKARGVVIAGIERQPGHPHPCPSPAGM